MTYYVYAAFAEKAGDAANEKRNHVILWNETGYDCRASACKMSGPVGG